MNKILQFLQSSSGELSSKRLCFMLANVVFIVGSIYFTNKLINKDQFMIATEMWSSLGIYGGVLGGYVASELFAKKPIKKDDEIV